MEAVILAVDELGDEKCRGLGAGGAVWQDKAIERTNCSAAKIELPTPLIIQKAYD